LEVELSAIKEMIGKTRQETAKRGRAWKRGLEAPTCYFIREKPGRYAYSLDLNH
jgi:hypothetical protein